MGRWVEVGEVVVVVGGGQMTEDDPGGKLMGTHFRAHLHQTNPPPLLPMSAVPALFAALSGCLCLSFCLPLSLSEELSLARPPQLLSDGRRATVFINTGWEARRPHVNSSTSGLGVGPTLQRCHSARSSKSPVRRLFAEV